MTMKRYHVGERIRTWPVDTWNRIVDATQEVEAGAIPQPERFNNRVNVIGNRILLKNTTGAVVGPGRILAIGDPTGDPNVNEQVAFEPPIGEGSVPTIDDNFRIAVLRYGCVANEVGEALTSGEVWAIVNVSNANHCACEVEPTNARLRSVDAGPHLIRWKPAGTGVKWCWVSLNTHQHATMYRATANTTISPGAVHAEQKTVSLLQWDADKTDTQRDPDVDWTHCDANQDDISNNQECLVVVTNYGGNELAYVVGRECPS